MIPGIGHWYACVAEPTPGMLRWDVARDRSRERSRMYAALGAITRSMKMPDADTVTTAEPGVGSVIETAEGVKEAGPDQPALAEATQREETARRATMIAAGPVGRVAPEQAGILPTGPMRVSEGMVERASQVAPDLGPELIRRLLMAALQG